MTFDDPRVKRRPSLTPMIDVVFLLLVFFMLASRFGMDMQLPLTVGGTSSTPYSGPPRLVQVEAEELRLNGAPVTPEDLVTKLETLTETPTDTIILRAGDEVPLQRMVSVMDALGAAGYSSLVLLE
nr:biopolymer transporter ExbD [uncultured Celeribacter sp.]